MCGLKYCALVCLLLVPHMRTAKTRVIEQCTTLDGFSGFKVYHYLCVNGTIVTDGGKIVTEKTGEKVPLVCCRKKDDEEVIDKTVLKCGIRNRDGVGAKTQASGLGASILPGELPWSVALFSTDQEQDLQDENGYFCGGTLIQPSVVLSATHCFNNRVPEEVRVRVGDWNIHESTELLTHQEIRVKQIIHRDDYYDGLKANNVALLILSQPAKLDKHVLPICLPAQDSQPSATSTCFGAGWGSDVNDIYPSTISKMKMQITARAACQEAYRMGIPNPIFKLHDSFICASSKAGRCAADGGSPLICSLPDSGNTFVQYGILSWASGCHTGSMPAIYSSVAKFRQWIDDTMAKHGFNSSNY